MNPSEETAIVVDRSLEEDDAVGEQVRYPITSYGADLVVEEVVRRLDREAPGSVPERPAPSGGNHRRGTDAGADRTRRKGVRVGPVTIRDSQRLERAITGALRLARDSEFSSEHLSWFAQLMTVWASGCLEAFGPASR